MDIRCPVGKIVLPNNYWSRRLRLLVRSVFKNRFDVFELKNNREREDEDSIRSAVQEG